MKHVRILPIHFYLICLGTLCLLACGEADDVVGPNEQPTEPIGYTRRNH